MRHSTVFVGGGSRQMTVEGSTNLGQSAIQFKILVPTLNIRGLVQNNELHIVQLFTQARILAFSSKWKKILKIWRLSAAYAVDSRTGDVNSARCYLKVTEFWLNRSSDPYINKCCETAFFNANPDLNFHLDADTDLDPDPTTNLHMLENRIFYFYSQLWKYTLFYLPCQRHTRRCQNFK